jgi:ankyrin repeat protein
MNFEKLQLLLEDIYDALIPKIQDKFISMINQESYRKLDDKQKASWKRNTDYNQLTDIHKQQLKDFIVYYKNKYQEDIENITDNMEYKKWLIQQLINKSLTLPEDKEKLKDALKSFDELKRKNNFTDSKNIKDYTADKLFQTIEKYNKEKSNEREDKQFNLSPVIYENDKYKLVELKNYNKFKSYLEYKKYWCVKNKVTFSRYNPPYYLIVQKENGFGKYLVHLKSAQFKNEFDKAITEEEINNELVDIVQWLIKNKNNDNHIFDNDFESFIDYYDISKMNKNDYNYLWFSCAKYNKIEKIKELINLGVDVNIKDKNGSTALIYASRNGYKDIVELLLKYKADINIKNKFGNTALIYALRNGYKEIVELLLKYKADVNIKDNYGSTALILASYNGHIEIVELLLKHGADVNIQNLSGNTALILASYNEHKEIVELLKRHGAK